MRGGPSQHPRLTIRELPVIRLEPLSKPAEKLLQLVLHIWGLESDLRHQGGDRIIAVCAGVSWPAWVVGLAANVRRDRIEDALGLRGKRLSR